MKPLFSAIGMNTPGGISPWLALRQRESASTEVILSSMASYIGW